MYMETSFIHADIFFFVSTIATIIFTVLGAIFLVYLIRIMQDVKKSTTVLKDSIEDASEDIVEIRRKIKESFIFNLIFRKKKRNKSGDSPS